MIKVFLKYCAAPFFKVYWKYTKPKTYGVKAIISSANDPSKILLVRHSYGDTSKWHLPGGGYKPKKETAEQAVIRETKEELSLDVTKLQELGAYKTSAEGKRDTVTIFSCCADMITLKQNAEIAEVKMVDVDDEAYLPQTYRITRFAIGLYRKGHMS